MNCDETREQLSAFVDGDLDQGIAVAVEAHLTDCESCRLEKEALVSLDATLTKTFVTGQKQAAVVAERVLRQLHSGECGSPPAIIPRRRIIRVLSYLVATVAGFLLAVGLFQAVGPFQLWQDDAPGIVMRRPALLPGNPPPMRAMPVAHLVHATGPVSFRAPTDDAWVAVARNALPVFACPAESAVRTEPGSLCELETSTGSRIRLNESSEIALRSEEELVLLNGQIWCRTTDGAVLRVVAESAPQPADLWTLRCTTSAECLTSRSVDGPLQVVTAAGKVELILNGTSQEIPSGTSCTLDEGEVTVRESADEVLQAERWMQPLLTMSGHTNAELTRRVDALLARIGRAKMSFLYEQDLRNLGEYGAVALMRFVQSQDSRQEPARRLVAMQIIADTAPIWMVPDLITLLEDEDPELRSLTAGALARIAGETQGLTTLDWEGDRPQWSDGLARWKAWWQQHRYSCPPPPPGVAQVPMSE